MPVAASTGTRRRLPSRRVEPSGTWGKWIDARLNAKTWTQQYAFDQLRGRWPALFPWGEKSIDSFRAYIRGKTPDDEQQAAFIELFGGPPPKAGGDDRDGPPPADLVAALAAQTEALNRLVDRLDRERDERDRDLVNTIAATVALAVRTTLQAAGIGDGPPQP